MHSKFLLSLAVISSTFFTECLAWQTADDCKGEDLVKVNAAMEEALNMAIYAKYRATDNAGSRKGTSLENFLGAPNEDDATSLALVAKWMQNVFDTGSAPVSATSNSATGILIHCSDAYLTKIADRKYRDGTRFNWDVALSPVPAGITPTDNPCGGFMQGFAYAGVFVLCNDGPNSAFSQSTNGATMAQFRTAGNLKTAPQVIEHGIDYMTQFLSSKILHELFHASSLCVQSLNWGTTCQFPNVLPDKVNGAYISEIYGYPAITGYSKIGIKDPAPANPPSVNNRQHNADSFSMLAVSWYLPPYGWSYGAVGSVGNRPVEKYTGQASAPASSNPSTKRRSFIERRRGLVA